MNRRVSIGWCLGLLLTWGLVGCGSEQSQWSTEREAWNETHPEHYRYDYTVTGFAPGRGPWRIEVRGDEVVSVRYVGQGTAPTPGIDVDSAPTIDTLFQQVESGLNTSARVDVDYDPVHHFPKRAMFSSGEEGSGFICSEFTPLD
ncbi:hypothetical protein JRI60_39925 [Archangium violaceum]|uniref:DUF6174 domain-containing protein n=1 Tax=Archangium violaceum TaxID=83451 RepID=UPI00194F74B6|nr:DUF6174 domain-containing protein [Archangium violaceum]QRN95192.1 hypothetical protein JRI60_39925 [Archangium violaceum]